MSANLHATGLLSVQVRGKTKNLVVIRGNRSTRSTGLFNVHPLVERFNSRYRTHLKVVSPQVADAALAAGVLSERPEFLVDVSIAYEKHGAKLGKEVVFAPRGAPKVVLATGKYQGENRAALATLGLSTADVAYTIEGKQRTLKEMLQRDGTERLLKTSLRTVSEIQLLIPDTRLVIVLDFPGQDGWYALHTETWVPHGTKVASYSVAACLFHRLNGSYVGIVARYGRSILAYHRASHWFQVVAEVPAEDIAAMQKFPWAGDGYK